MQRRNTTLLGQAPNPVRSMTIPCWVAAILGLLLLVGFSQAADTKAFSEKIEPILADYCYDCHGDGSDEGDFVMDDYGADTINEHLDNMAMWYEVWKNTRSNLMPPSDKEQPTDEEREQMLAFIEKEVFHIDPENPDPGVVTIRRLNREEYRNTIKDLFGFDFDVNDAFPADDTGYGFDTIGAVLSISPLLMEKISGCRSRDCRQSDPARWPADSGKLVQCR